MLAIYIMFIFLGVAMLVIGFAWLIQGFNGKEIIQFPMSERKQEFEITKNGKYGVFVVGTKYLRKTGDFSARLREINTQTEVEVEECAIKFKTNTIRIKMVEFFQFEIPFPGKYRIEFENIDKIHVNTYRIKGGDRHRPIGGEHLQILIKKTISPWKKLASILFLCFGFNVLLWGIMVALNPGMVK